MAKKNDKPKKVKPACKKAGPGKRKVGRPRVEIDYEQLQKLCQIMATKEEIAFWFGISVDTIENRCREEFGTNFSAYYKKHTAFGKISLRRAQFQTAIGGNAAMQIWLGKQILGQRDNPESDTEDSPRPIKYVIQVEDASTKDKSE